MAKKIVELTGITLATAETGMEFEIQQEGISYKISLSQMIEMLKTYFVTVEGGAELMPKTGGTFTGPITADGTNPTEAFELRPAKAVTEDPGAGSPLTTGHVLMVYDDQ